MKKNIFGYLTTLAILVLVVFLLFKKTNPVDYYTVLKEGISFDASYGDTIVDFTFIKEPEGSYLLFINSEKESSYEIQYLNDTMMIVSNDLQEFKLVFSKKGKLEKVSQHVFQNNRLDIDEIYLDIK